MIEFLSHNTCNVDISIIVASYNSELTIEKTLRSIIDQNCKSIEIILVDGGSTDETLSIVNSINCDYIFIISEIDRGIGDAWNKGLIKSRGSVIGFLNSDDYYDLGILPKILPFLLNEKIPLIGYGDVTLINKDNIKLKIVNGKIRTKLELLNGFGFMHPSVFFNRLALNEVGFFDINIRIAVDTDWLLRALTKKIKFIKIPSHTFMRTGGRSNIYKYTGMGEYADCLINNGYSDLYMLLFFALRFIGHFRRILINFIF